MNFFLVKCEFNRKRTQNCVVTKLKINLCSSSVLTERGAEVLVRVQGLHTALVAQVPDAQRFVIAGGNHVLAARMEHDAPDPVVVAGEREQTQPGADVPNLWIERRKIRYNLE